MSPTQRAAWLLVAALCCAGCTFQTEAIDGALGTSCGHYELSRLTTEQRASCWVEAPTDGPCFMSSQGACSERRATTWAAGVELTQWCPIGDPGTQVNVVVPCD